MEPVHVYYSFFRLAMLIHYPTMPLNLLLQYARFFCMLYLLVVLYSGMVPRFYNCLCMEQGTLMYLSSLKFSLNVWWQLFHICFIYIYINAFINRFLSNVFVTFFLNAYITIMLQDEMWKTRCRLIIRRGLWHLVAVHWAHQSSSIVKIFTLYVILPSKYLYPRSS